MRSCFSGRRIGMKQGVVGGKQDSGSVSNGLHQLTSASGAFLTCTKGSFQSCVKNKNDPPPSPPILLTLQQCYSCNFWHFKGGFFGCCCFLNRNKTQTTF